VRLVGDESAVVGIIVVVEDADVEESGAVPFIGSLVASKFAGSGTGQCAQGLGQDGRGVLHASVTALVSVLESCDLPVHVTSSASSADLRGVICLRRVDIQLGIVLPRVDDLALHEGLCGLNVRCLVTYQLEH
jgi:hypothetical protein